VLKLSTLQFWYEEHIHYAFTRCCASRFSVPTTCWYTSKVILLLACLSIACASLRCTPCCRTMVEAMSERVPADLLLDPQRFQCGPEMTLEDHVGL
jgi:hypothetical protein